jgi:hypothetical protein
MSVLAESSSMTSYSLTVDEKVLHEMEDEVRRKEQALDQVKKDLAENKPVTLDTRTLYSILSRLELLEFYNNRCEWSDTLYSWQGDAWLNAQQRYIEHIRKKMAENGT